MKYFEALLKPLEGVFFSFDENLIENVFLDKIITLDELTYVLSKVKLNKALER